MARADPPPALAALFPPAVRLAVAADRDERIPALAEEARHIAGSPCFRQREFALGRTCARRALAACGAPPGPVERSADRSPIWPPGFVGSITHSAGFCAAAAAPDDAVRGVGIDAEPLQTLDPGLARLICTPREAARLRSPGPTGVDWPLLVFCAKEAFYKAWYPSGGRILSFNDVELSFDLDTLTFTVGDVRPSGPSGGSLGRVGLTGSHVVAGFSFLP